MTSSRIASGSDESEVSGTTLGRGITVIAVAAIDASISGACQKSDGGARLAARISVPIHVQFHP